MMPNHPPVNRRFHTIRFRLIGAFVLAVLLPALVISLFTVISGIRTGMSQAINQLNSVATLKQAQLDVWLNELQAEMSEVLDPTSLADLNMLRLVLAPSEDSSMMRDIANSRLRTFLTEALQRTGHFEAMFLVTPDGLTLVSTDETLEKQITVDQSLFQQAVTQPYIQPATFSTPGQATLLVLHPIFENNQLLGVLVGRANLNKANEIMTERAGLGRTGETYLVDKTGLLLTSSRFVGYTPGLTYVAAEFIKQRLSGAGSYLGYRGDTVVGVYHWWPRLGVMMLAEQTQSEALAATFSTLLVNLGVTVVAMVIFAGLGLLFVERNLTKPLTTLSETATRIADGELQLRVDLARQDEIGVLADSFNRMTSQLSDFINNLEHRVAERTKFLQTSASISQQITTLLELDLLLQFVINLLQQAFDFYHINIYLVDETTQTLKFVICSTGYTPPNTVTLGEGVVGQVALTKTLLLNNEVAAGQVSLSETRSELAVPLLVGIQLLGVLDIHSKQVNRFSHEDVTLLESIGAQLGIAVRNAQLYGLAQQEINERKRAETALQLANRELAKLNSSKDRFFSVLAHDLKGPFMPLLGGSELLAEMGEQFTPQQVQEMGLSIHRSARNVYNLLQNLLQWSRIQMGHLEYQPTHLDLVEIIKRNVELLGENAKTKGIRLQIEVQPPLMVKGDEYMLDTVIRNLISNALKFTPTDGQVTVFTEIMKPPALVAHLDIDPPATLYVQVAIQDTGIGIDEADLQKLFRLDVRHTTLGTAHEQGTGLGLILCHEMISRHGGQIWAESRPGEGTTFKFTLPMDDTIVTS